MDIKQYLDAFREILIPIHSEKVVIGGIWALRLHGLKVRDTQDLDIVLYSPPESVLNLIKEIVKEDDPDNYPRDKEHSPRRSFKITRGELTVDFLIEYDKYPADELLCFMWSDRLWRVQTIPVVMDAKRSYNRDKDHHDFASLKHDNFNW